MKLNNKNLSKLGFKATHLLRSATSLDIHWKQFGSKVVFADGIQDRIGVFHLTKAQLKEFKANKLSLVPPGCCATSNRNTKEDAVIVYEGEPRSGKHLQELLKIALTSQPKSK